MKRGFTLIELLISVGIFVIMTALVVANYGNFNTSTLLTDTAYDVALALRTAQTYGLSVKNVEPGATNFSASYGVDFNSNSCKDNGQSSDATHFILFADINGNNNCNGSGDVAVNVYTLTRGASIYSLCAGSAPGASCISANQLDVIYTRPNPEAKICVNGSCSNTYAEITIVGSDAKSTKTIAVRENGQITVLK